MQIDSNINEFQEKLKAEAKQVLEELQVIETLLLYGRPNIIGSLALGVMTRRDIDIEIIVNTLSKKVVTEAAQKFLSLSLPRLDITVIDNTKPYTQSFPLGIYLGITYVGKDEFVETLKSAKIRWDIDMWFLEKNQPRGTKMTEEFLALMTPEKRRIILDIKYALTQSTDYKGKYSGVDIYKAVLRNNIKTKEDFLKFIS